MASAGQPTAPMEGQTKARPAPVTVLLAGIGTIVPAIGTLNAPDLLQPQGLVTDARVTRGRRALHVIGQVLNVTVPVVHALGQLANARRVQLGEALIVLIAAAAQLELLGMMLNLRRLVLHPIGISLDACAVELHVLRIASATPGLLHGLLGASLDALRLALDAACRVVDALGRLFSATGIAHNALRLPFDAPGGAVDLPRGLIDASRSARRRRGTLGGLSRGQGGAVSRKSGLLLAPTLRHRSSLGGEALGALGAKRRLTFSPLGLEAGELGLTLLGRGASLFLSGLGLAGAL